MLSGDKPLEGGCERGSKRPASHGESADGAKSGGGVAKGQGLRLAGQPRQYTACICVHHRGSQCNHVGQMKTQYS
jgi:hypothetical protein